MTDDEREPHEAKAAELERELDDMDERREQLGAEIDDAGDAWERKKRDDRVPGAAGQPEQADGPEPEAEYPSKHQDDDEDG